MTDLKISCLPVSLYPQIFSGELSIPQWARLGAQERLDAIDINALFFQNLGMDAIASLKEQLPLPVLMVSAYSDFTNPDPAQRQRAQETAIMNIRKAAQIGASFIRLTAGPFYPGQQDDRTVEWVYDGFEACIPASQLCKVRILMENHSRPGAWPAPDFNFHPDRLELLWEKLKPLPISVNFDTANAYALGDWRRILRLFAGRIETVHLNDLSGIDPLRFCIVGEGIVPLAEMLCAVVQTGSCGWCSLEEAGGQGVEGLKKAIANMRSLCERISQRA